jgi:N-dimethylarginine dimethylaminohydrolase
VTDAGAILLRPGKESRRDEVAAIRADFEPRVGLALDGNPETRRRMEASGVDVQTYRGEELSRKGDGGPTCLTRPLARG